MPISSALNAICDLLKRETGLPAQTGLPRGTKEGLYVWPYRLVLTEARATSPRPAGTPPESPGVSLDIPLLVLARPAFAESGLNALDAALRALMQNPVIAFPAGRVQVMLDSRLGIADLIALFAAARMQPSLALEFVARATVTNADP